MSVRASDQKKCNNIPTRKKEIKKKTVRSSPCDPNFTFKVTKAKHDKIQWKMWKKWMKFRNRLAPLARRSDLCRCHRRVFFFRSAWRLMHEKGAVAFGPSLQLAASVTRTIDNSRVCTLYVLGSLGFAFLFFIRFVKPPPNPIILFPKLKPRVRVCAYERLCISR